MDTQKQKRSAFSGKIAAENILDDGNFLWVWH